MENNSEVNNKRVVKHFVLQEYVLDQRSREIVRGVSVGQKVATGKVHVIDDISQIYSFKKGEILVTEMTDPDWIEALAKAGAIITNKGSRLSHPAIVAQEYETPCIVGTSGYGVKATDVLQDGQEITVSCAEGYAYEGILPFHIEEKTVENFTMPRTKMLLIIQHSLGAFKKSFMPNDGVGLAREEFIISDTIRCHPMAFVRYPHVAQETRDAVDRISFGYSDKKQFFVDRLAEGIGKIGAAFYPKVVIPRFSDFKSNEYKNLTGGQEFEPSNERNPMIGLRGASRYRHPIYREAFELEVEAVKKVIEVFGLTNIIPMIPFVRTPEELDIVLNMMANRGLKRGKNGLKVFMMCEVPSNVILADEFASLVDGFSIGSNDLKQLVFGMDRDEETLRDIADERHPALKRAISYAIERLHLAGKPISICGEAPSYFPDFAQFLVECGIDSMSLEYGQPLLKTMMAVKEIEDKFAVSR